ncbi:hypothetical protein LTR54_017941 [Friedmanniomyces endolithicus]|uniref:Uncharacterized protein n=1 Tax=Friedmanniomyces endolithicus TaxID=329885 RepID=A0AAN6J447_9PEZI|nr:hypothetical protein LTR82_017649 [Friedmanniomyces endolithicus]KAK0970545.1 hypothetical protein LTR54_017941 [Friedmanniomyces endolithicus]
MWLSQQSTIFDTRSDTFASPLHKAWQAHYRANQKDPKTRITPALATKAAPWLFGEKALRLVIPGRPNALSELRRAQKEAGKALVYTDASARNGLTGIGLVGPKETNVIGSFTAGWMSTCSIAAAEVRAIGIAVRHLLDI